MTRRRAYVCLDKKKETKDQIIHRIFLLPGEPEPPICPIHGRMTPQPNHPYRGKPT